MALKTQRRTSREPPKVPGTAALPSGVREEVGATWDQGAKSLPFWEHVLSAFQMFPVLTPTSTLFCRQGNETQRAPASCLGSHSGETAELFDSKDRALD